ncbi:hypothetical protein LCM23_06160 [Cytobacillus kochii]|uniref:hypothetical protein n=1 Tax=Cytobacillus kochii TaxID=859143 RepID=UPI001CD50CF8|nr:hypothetical protein [Cytobacillus kochii]MCA1025668.1 hypothetical protein [Cytobacillus kochii]
MNLKIKNSLLKAFAEFLMTFELKGKESRLRTRFVKLLDAQLKQINDETQLLAKDYCHLDDEGSPKLIEVDGHQLWDIRDHEEWAKAINELFAEELHISGEDKKEMLTAVKEIVLNSEDTYNGQAAFDYDIWCELVESIEE